MNAAYYARHARAVELAGGPRALTAREVSILLIAAEAQEQHRELLVGMFAPLLGLDVHPAPELRALTMSGLLEFDRGNTHEDQVVKLSDRGSQVAGELRGEITNLLSRWVTRIRLAAA